jgi:hypothetical protein
MALPLARELNPSRLRVYTHTDLGPTPWIVEGGRFKVDLSKKPSSSPHTLGANLIHPQRDSGKKTFFVFAVHKTLSDTRQYIGKLEESSPVKAKTLGLQMFLERALNTPGMTRDYDSRTIATDSPYFAEFEKYIPAADRASEGK